jgi:hypothetical protein
MKNKVSAARRDRIRVAVVERGIRPVDVSRLLGILTASVAEHLAAIRRDKKRSYEPRNVPYSGSQHDGLPRAGRRRFRSWEQCALRLTA